MAYGFDKESIPELCFLISNFQNDCSRGANVKGVNEVNEKLCLFKTEFLKLIEAAAKIGDFNSLLL